MRQVVLDTETTGLEVEQQHRVIEIGCVELFNRRLTGRSFHRYLNPERDIDEGALEVHGLTREQLAKEPKFAEIHAEFLDFVRDAELVIHNAPFDIAFLNAELARLEQGTQRIDGSLQSARHAGSRAPNASRDSATTSTRCASAIRSIIRIATTHGALLDARILAEVYLAMTGGQAKLILSAESDTVRGAARRLETPSRARRYGAHRRDHGERGGNGGP